MSAPRLILKQPTGWFAAGREFAQAITLLSDGTFKLYVYACMRAGRQTGCLRATLDELARAMTRAPTTVTMNLDELEERAVCRVTRNGGPQLVLEIRDSFWPYLKQQTPGCAPEPEAEFVRKVRGLFLAPACVQASFSAAPHHRNAGPHRRERWPTSNGIQLPATRQDENEMRRLDVLFTLFLTHVGHMSNVKSNQRRFAPTLAHFTGIGGPLHRNTQCRSPRPQIRVEIPAEFPEIMDQ